MWRSTDAAVCSPSVINRIAARSVPPIVAASAIVFAPPSYELLAPPGAGPGRRRCARRPFDRRSPSADAIGRPPTIAGYSCAAYSPPMGAGRDRLRPRQHLHHRPQHEVGECQHEHRAEHLPPDGPDLRVLPHRRRGRSRDRGVCWNAELTTEIVSPRISSKPTACFTSVVNDVISCSVSGVDAPRACAGGLLSTSTPIDRRLIEPTAWRVWLTVLSSSKLRTATCVVLTGVSGGRGLRRGRRPRDLRRLVAERARHALHAFAAVRVLACVCSLRTSCTFGSKLSRVCSDREIDLGGHARSHALCADDRAERDS